jgi:hypothetical protein
MEGTINHTGSYNTQRFEIHKSSDGVYWQILLWVRQDALLRLRMMHTSLYDPTDFIAEIKVIDTWDPRCGRGDYGFAMVGKFSLGIDGVAEQTRDIQNNPEDWPCDAYPTIYGDEFAQLAVLLKELLEFDRNESNVWPI